MRFLKRYFRQGALGDMLYVAAGSLLTAVTGTKAAGKAPVIQGDGSVAWIDVATLANVQDIVGTLGQISIPTVFLMPEDGAEQFATILAASTEIDTSLRRRRVLTGAGSYRINAIVTAAAATANVTVKYSTDGFSSSTALTALPLTSVGRLTTGWIATPTGLRTDVELSPFFSSGAGTDGVQLALLEIEFLPDLVTTFRDFSDDFSDDFS